MKGAIDAFLIFLRGLLMGIADTIPGVSGGTIAFITGIYDRLVGGIAEVTNIGIEISKRRWKGFQTTLKRIDFHLFVPLGAGIILAIFFFSGVMSYLLKEHAASTNAFFFGLILASTLFVFRKISGLSPGVFISGFVGFVFSFSLIGFGFTESLGHSLPVIFLSGAIAISAWILPGISGAFVLLIMGQYEHLIDALHSFDVVTVMTFAAGAATGILSFTKLLQFVLKRYLQLTLAFLAGLMLGSLRLTVEEMANGFTGALPLIIFGTLGLVLVILVEYIFGNAKKE